MPIHGMKLLSKAIENNDARVFERFRVEEYHFLTKAERRIFRFIQEYAKRNQGRAPNHIEVAAQFPEFEYYPETAESYEYLSQCLKDDWAKAELVRLFQGNAGPKDPGKKDEFLGSLLHERDGKQLVEWLQEEIQRVKLGTDVLLKVGKSLKHDSEWFLKEYNDRAKGTSLRIWKSAFATINDEIGGYTSGNMYTWYGRSGRGKSVFTLREALAAALQGAVVLIWSLEMPTYEVYARAYSMLSALKGVYTAKIEGVNYEVGFGNREILQGQLDERFRPAFEKFVREDLREMLGGGDLIVRGLDDPYFNGRTVRDLEADINATGAQVVVVDPFYYMDYEQNTSRVKGGDAANTSKKLRALAGKLKIVLHVITQAEEVRDDRDDDGNRELRPPRRAEIQKTKAVLHDATNTFGIDTIDGQGIIELGKGRSGGEGVQVEILYLPQHGIVRDLAEENSEVGNYFDIDAILS